jgi:hypothetical protein
MDDGINLEHIVVAWLIEMFSFSLYIKYDDDDDLWLTTLKGATPVNYATN